MHARRKCDLANDALPAANLEPREAAQPCDLAKVYTLA